MICSDEENRRTAAELRNTSEVMNKAREYVSNTETRMLLAHVKSLAEICLAQQKRIVALEIEVTRMGGRS